MVFVVVMIGDFLCLCGVMNFDVGLFSLLKFVLSLFVVSVMGTKSARAFFLFKYENFFFSMVVVK